MYFLAYANTASSESVPTTAASGTNMTNGTSNRYCEMKVAGVSLSKKKCSSDKHKCFYAEYKVKGVKSNVALCILPDECESYKKKYLKMDKNGKVGC